MSEWKEDWCTYEIYAYDQFGSKVSYFGHTGDFMMRLGCHLTSYASWVRQGRSKSNYGEHGCSSVLVIDMDSWTIERRESFETEADAIDHERELILTNDCVNIQVPKRTRKEWLQDHAEERSVYMKEWAEAHKDWLKMYRSTRYQGKREEILAKQKQYTERTKQMVECPCSCIIDKRHYNIHLKSKKHHNLITNAPPPVLKHPTLAVKIPCVCGLMIATAGMNDHLKTKKHAQRMTPTSSNSCSSPSCASSDSPSEV